MGLHLCKTLLLQSCNAKGKYQGTVTKDLLRFGLQRLEIRKSHVSKVTIFLPYQLEILDKTNIFY